jgi:hypothetical protein
MRCRDSSVLTTKPRPPRARGGVTKVSDVQGTELIRGQRREGVNEIKRSETEGARDAKGRCR